MGTFLSLYLSKELLTKAIFPARPHTTHNGSWEDMEVQAGLLAIALEEILIIWGNNVNNWGQMLIKHAHLIGGIKFQSS